MKKIQDVLVNVKDPTKYTPIQKDYTGFAVIRPGGYVSLYGIFKKVDANISK